MEMRYGPPYISEVPKAGDAEEVNLERCEAYTPKVDKMREDKYLARAKANFNPISAFMASMYQTREQERNFLYDFHEKSAKSAEDVLAFRATANRKESFQVMYKEPLSKWNAAREAAEPSKGSFNRYLWEYTR